MSLTKVKAGNILLTTPSASSNDVTPATTQYVTTAIDNLVDTAPSTLNTLNELAAALGDDVNFSTTVTNSIATKLPLAGGTLTGALIGTSATFSPSSGKTFVIASDSGDGPYIGTTVNKSLRIITNNTTRITLLAAGGVGIGEALPDLPLHVSGTVALPATSGSTPTGFISLRAKTAGGSHGLHMGVSNASPWGSWLQAQDANNLATEYPLLLNPNGGNVGIGTVSPAKLLHLSESADGAKLRITRAGLSEWDFSIGNTSTLTGVGSGALEILPQNGGTANELAIGTAGSAAPLVHITNSQNYFKNKVGIGTSSPQSNLDINGNMVARGDLFFGTNPSNTLSTTPNNTNWHHIGYAGGANYHITGSVQGDMTIGAIPGTGITFGTVVAGQPVPLKSMNISSGGIVTMPYQPAMFAQPNSSNTVQIGVGAKKFGWNTSGGPRFNRGFTLSGASGNTVFDGQNTGKITVPMDGVYHLYFDMRCESTGGDGQAGVFINGAQVLRRHIQEWATIPYSHCTITATFNLQASDYIEMGMWWNSVTGGPVSGLSDTVNWMSLTKIA
jgi:hypothetical protein